VSDTGPTRSVLCRCIILFSVIVICILYNIRYIHNIKRITLFLKTTTGNETNRVLIIIYRYRYRYVYRGIHRVHHGLDRNYIITWWFRECLLLIIMYLHKYTTTTQFPCFPTSVSEALEVGNGLYIL
jgi:hypothetical protein